MMNELIIQEKEQLSVLTENKAKQIKAAFSPMMDKLEKVEEAYNEIVNLEVSRENCKLAKRMRIDISKIRTDAEKIKTAQKEEYNRAGKAIQGIYNIIKFAVVSKEEKLKNIELHYEKIEEEKKAKLQLDRQVELAKYDADGEFVDLGNMPDEVWMNYILGVKNNFEAIKEAEKKAESDRIEAEKKEAEEREAIRLENERLKIEAEKAEKKRIADQKKLDAEREKQEAKLKVEREKAEAEKRIQDEIIRKEREAKEKLEREIAEKSRLEKIEADRLKSEQKKLESAPDKEKLFSVATKLRNTKTTVKSPKAKQALENAALLLEKIAEVI